MNNQTASASSRSRSHSPRALFRRSGTAPIAPSPLRGRPERGPAQAINQTLFSDSVQFIDSKQGHQSLEPKPSPTPTIHLQRTATVKDPSPAESTAPSEDDDYVWQHHSNLANQPQSYQRPILRLQKLDPNENVELFPKTIRCELYVSFNSPRENFNDFENGPEVFDDFKWTDENCYDDIRNFCNHKIERYKLNADLVKRKIYLRYGTCSVKGPSDETPFSPDKSFFREESLHQIAIKAVCRFIAEHTHQRITLVIRCDYGSLPEHNTDLDDSSSTFSDLMVEQYDEKLEIPAINILGQKYISRADLDQLTSVEVSKRLIDEKTGDNEQEKAELMQMMAENPAQTLLAVCISERISLKLFRHFLVKHNYRDANLGQIAHDMNAKNKGFDDARGSRCPTRGCDHDRKRLHDGMHKFFAQGIMQDRLFYGRGDLEIVPISYAGDNKDLSLIGGGAFSQVYEVCIDVRHRFGIFDSGLAKTYALKVFKNDIKEEKRQKAFRTEMRALLHLAMFPHDHILTHITSWEQRDNFYILYDKAETNLGEYMKRNPGGKLTGSRILWFVAQLRGLADAVRRVHHFKEPSKTDLHRVLKPRKSKSTGVVGYHHDIKPENILVFGTPKKDPVLKLSDFGAGKFSKVRKLQESGQATKDAHGTLSYFGPEYPLKMNKSRPFDMWALGCVFLEFLLWFLDLKRPLKGKTFSELRIEMSGSKDPGVIDYFWAHKNLSSSSVRGTKSTVAPDSDSDLDSPHAASSKNQLLGIIDGLEHNFDAFELNQAVEEVLVGLEEEWCAKMWVFQRILKQIRRLLEIKPKERLSAATLADRLDSYLAQTHVDLEKNSLQDREFAMENEKNLYAKQFQENKEDIIAKKTGQPINRTKSNPGIHFLSTTIVAMPIADAQSMDESSTGSGRRRSLELERSADTDIPLVLPESPETSKATGTVGAGSHLAGGHIPADDAIDNLTV